MRIWLSNPRNQNALVSPRSYRIAIIWWLGVTMGISIILILTADFLPRLGSGRLLEGEAPWAIVNVCSLFFVPCALMWSANFTRERWQQSARERIYEFQARAATLVARSTCAVFLLFLIVYLFFVNYQDAAGYAVINSTFSSRVSNLCALANLGVGFATGCGIFSLQTISGPFSIEAGGVVSETDVG